jgi:hypothetical protein
MDSNNNGNRIRKAIKTISMSHNHCENGNSFLIEVGNLLKGIESPNSFQAEAIAFYDKYVIDK